MLKIEVLISTGAPIYICYVQVEILYKLQLVQKAVQVATCTSSLYKFQLVQNWLYKLQIVQNFTIRKTQTCTVVQVGFKKNFG